MNRLSEVDKDLVYDRRGKRYPAIPTHGVIGYTKLGGFTVDARLVQDLPDTFEECRALAHRYGVVLIHSPLRILDRMFRDFSRKEKAFLSCLGESSSHDLFVRPLSTRGFNKVSFLRDGNRRDHIINLWKFGDTSDEALLFAEEVYLKYSIGLESLVSPAHVLQCILMSQCKGAFGLLGEDVEVYAYQCYKAGRFEAVEIGTQEADIYDMNSAYLSGLARLQNCFPPFVSWRLGKPSVKTVLSESVCYAFCRCLVKLGSFHISPLLMRFLSSTGRVRLLTPTYVTVETWLAKPEIEVLTQCGGASVEIVEGCVATREVENLPFKNVARQLYGMRRTFGRAFKQIGAMAPGKMASLITIMDPVYPYKRYVQSSPIFNPVYAAHVASYVRALVTAAMLNDPKSVIRCAVDGIAMKKGSAPLGELSGALGGLRQTQGLVTILSDQFSDKPGSSLYRDTYTNGSFEVGGFENYPSLIANWRLGSDDFNLAKRPRYIQCKPSKRFCEIPPQEPLTHCYPTIPPRSEGDLSKLLLVPEVFSDYED